MAALALPTCCGGAAMSMRENQMRDSGSPLGLRCETVQIDSVVGDPYPSGAIAR